MAATIPHTDHHAVTPGRAVRLAPSVLAQMVASAAEGDERAWNALVDEFSGLVWAVARAHRLSDSDAGDVAQATWLRLVEHLGSLRDPARVGAWLATTARREALRVLRTASRQLPMGDDVADEPDETVDIARNLLDEERDAALWQAFRRLSDRDQALLRLLVAEPQPSYQEIASSMGMPIGSLGPTRARALERLRRELAREAPAWSAA